MENGKNIFWLFLSLCFPLTSHLRFHCPSTALMALRLCSMKCEFDFVLISRGTQTRESHLRCSALANVPRIILFRWRGTERMRVFSCMIQKEKNNCINSLCLYMWNKCIYGWIKLKRWLAYSYLAQSEGTSSPQLSAAASWSLYAQCWGESKLNVSGVVQENIHGNIIQAETWV